MVSLVSLVYPVSLVQANKRNKPNKLETKLADFFSILRSIDFVLGSGGN
jgi:hypothetical protein